MSDPYRLVHDGNGIIALVQINNEAFHSQEIAMRASIRMWLFMVCCISFIQYYRLKKKMFLLSVLAYFWTFKNSKRKSHFFRKNLEQCMSARVFPRIDTDLSFIHSIMTECLVWFILPQQVRWPDKPWKLANKTFQYSHKASTTLYFCFFSFLIGVQT